MPSCLSVWQHLLTSDVFFESESAFFSSECDRQQRSVRVRLNAGLYTEFLLPHVITKHAIHFTVNPTFPFQWIQWVHELLPSKIQKESTRQAYSRLRLCIKCSKKYEASFHHSVLAFWVFIILKWFCLMACSYFDSSVSCPVTAEVAAKTVTAAINGVHFLLSIKNCRSHIH